MTRAAGHARLLSRVAVACLAFGCHAAPAARSSLDFEPGELASFELDGEPFCFAGSNNYYPIYKTRPVVDDLFASARALGLKVMRVWGMLERGSLDGSIPSVDGQGEKQGVYFQYWDAQQQRPAYNDGENGLQRLDYVLAAAAKQDIKLIVVLTNNWREFGGMDQYLAWYGKQQHHEFFTSAEVKQAYRDWVAHVLLRKSALTGRQYREDPTILGWELANEPRARNGSVFDRDTGWDHDTLTSWAAEMSSYVKSLDSNHLVSIGDEGFLNQGGEHWIYRGHDGVDHRALSALPDVDFATFHLYPQHWGLSPSAGDRWILEHLRVARDLGKPTLLEEYGVSVQRAPDNRGAVSAGWPLRRDTYRRWNDTLLQHGGSAALAWMLAGRDDDGRRYPDYDGYAFYADDDSGRLLGEYARRYPEAPACQAAATPARSDSSGFVRVRRAEPAGAR